MKPPTINGMSRIPTDLTSPPVTDEAPAPGKRVRQVNPGFATTKIHHVLYLPVDWRPGRRYPVIVEYAGNQYGSSLGTVEGSSLGYGISAGQGFLWVCLPFVDIQKKENALTWWGDVKATVDYCQQTVQRVCAEYGGDPQAVFLAGFSRGAIACNYIGLHDDAIAKLWVGFIAHSHYDGVIESWGYPAADRAAARTRLQRLQGRPVFISHEQSVAPTRRYLEATGVQAPVTYVELPYPDHTDAWVLRDLPERQRLREWVRDVLRQGRKR